MQYRAVISHAARAALLAVLLTRAPTALAVPSFARQTGMACEACHTVYPELTHFGRVFKASGYVLDNLKQVHDVSSKKEQLLELAQTPPLSIMLQVSYTQLKTALPDLANVNVPGEAQNGTAGFPQQLSLFYAGKIAPHFGAFVQFTYANASGTFGIDNTDLRFADTKILPNDQSLIYGVSLNNNPTVQDLWNTTPAFGFPYASSNAMVSPLAHTTIDGGLAQNVAGLSAYAFWNESVYAELGGYRSAKQGAANQVTGAAGPLDGTVSNVISGVAPYWRVAYEHNWDRHSIEAGVYGADFRLLPGGSAGAPSPLRGPFNRFKDVAEDSTICPGSIQNSRFSTRDTPNSTAAVRTTTVSDATPRTTTRSSFCSGSHTEVHHAHRRQQTQPMPPDCPSQCASPHVPDNRACVEPRVRGGIRR